MTASDQADTLNNANAADAAAQTTRDSNPASGAADQAAGKSDANALSALETQLAAAKKEAADNYDRYVRLAADMENLRRRTVREKEELRQFAAGRVLEDLLPVLDNLALGLTAAKAPNADLKGLIGGISMVQDQLKNALSGHGLKEINPAGQTFDPNLHESIASQPSAEVPEGAVVQVVRTGYSLNGRLLRPASVVVSGGAAKGEATN